MGIAALSRKSTATSSYTAAWNLLGNPAAAAPAGVTDAGLPLSVQVIGPTDGELAVIALLVLLCLMGVLVLFAAVVLANAAMVGSSALSSQRERLVALREEVQALPGGVLASWADTSATAEVGEDTTVDRLQMVASHNSYVEAPNTVQNLAIAVGQPSRLAPLQYSHPPLWEQLDAGVRSLELDVRVRDDGTLSIVHAPLTADGGNAVDFLLALDEIALWSSSRPAHLPITVLGRARAPRASTMTSS